MNLDFQAAVTDRDYDVAFRVRLGETVALLGPNGAGKSTTLDVLSGLLRPESGIAMIGDEILFRIGRPEPRVWTPPYERRIALLAQEGLLFPHLTARDNVGFAARAKGASARASREQADRWLAEVGIPELGDRKPRSLSGGQVQRVAVARALASDPRLFLLDEPMASLDAGAVPAMRELLARVLAGRSAILVTHDPLDALVLADRVVVLENGRVIQQGATRDVLAEPSTDFLRQLTFGIRGLL